MTGVLIERGSLDGETDTGRRPARNQEVTDSTRSWLRDARWGLSPGPLKGLIQSQGSLGLSLQDWVEMNGYH